MALLNNSEELYFKSMILLKFQEKAVTVVYQKESARKLVDKQLSKLWKAIQTLSMTK